MSLSRARLPSSRSSHRGTQVANLGRTWTPGSGSSPRPVRSSAASCCAHRAWLPWQLQEKRQMMKRMQESVA